MYRASVFFAVISLFMFISSCSDDPVNVIDIEDPDDDPAEVLDISVPEGFIVEVFADDVELPTSVEFPPDGTDRLFVNELQSGKIWIYENGERLQEPFADLALNIEGGFPVSGENGLLGLEFDPDYQNNGYVYVTFAAREESEEIASVARFTDVNNRAENYTVLLSGLPSDKGHQIENLRFGPDGMIYVSVGDAYEQNKVQDVNEFHGKILRMTPEGEIPADNPFGPDNYVYALGFRNAFDLLFRENGDLLASDNGPTGMDKFMVVEAGGNYGWPNELGFHNNPEYVNPIHVWRETVSPTGMHVYRGDQFPSEYQGKLFKVLFGLTYSEGPNTNGKRLQWVDIEGEGQGTEVTFNDFAVWQFNDGFPNNPVDVTEGPDGSLYVTDIFQGKIFRISYQP
jgi:glucose/arabinose dehydrogenase